MTLFDYLYNISLHVIYAKIIPNVVHDITTMIIAISFFVAFYFMARLFFNSCLKSDNTMIELMKIDNKHTWKVESKPDENIQKNS